MPQEPKGSVKENAIRGIINMVAKVAYPDVDDDDLLEIEQLALPALMAMPTPEKDAIRGIVVMVAMMASGETEADIWGHVEELAVPGLMAMWHRRNGASQGRSDL
jgi:hypothetical protein